MGKGHVLDAYAARAHNVTDGVVTFDEVVRKMQRDTKASARPDVSQFAQARRALGAS